MAELAGLLLAAGGSSRLGRAKQLVEHAGEALVHRAARLLLTQTKAVTVVTGARSEAVAEALGTLSVATLHNPHWRAGVGTSIALAMQSVPEDFRGVLILLCDQYLLEADDLEQLVAGWQADRTRITAARWADSFGPPVIFPNRFFPELSQLSGDRGARQLLVSQRARVRFVSMPRAAADVDNAADLDRLRALRGSAQGALGDEEPSR